jgi:hypothetical protein
MFLRLATKQSGKLQKYILKCSLNKGLTVICFQTAKNSEIRLFAGESCKQVKGVQQALLRAEK